MMALIDELVEMLVFLCIVAAAITIIWYLLQTLLGVFIILLLVAGIVTVWRWIFGRAEKT